MNLNTKLKTLIRYKRWEIEDLGWGLRTRHLVFVLLFLWGGNYAASRKTTATYTSSNPFLLYGITIFVICAIYIHLVVGGL